MKKIILLALLATFTVNAQTVTDYVTAISPPSGIEFDNAGNLFIGDYLNYKIIKVDLSGNKSTITSALAGSPNQITLDLANNIWVSSEFFTKITKVTQTGILTTYDALGNAFGIAINNGFVYFTEAGPGNIKKLEISTGLITTFKSSITSPRGLTFDNLGNLFVACGNSTATNKVIKITPAGIVTDFITGINSPTYITFNTNGDLYISTGSLGIIYRLGSNDVNGSQTVYATGLGSAYGIKIRNNELFVARQGSGLNKISRITLPTLGLNDNSYSKKEIIVYPNPAKEFININNIDANTKNIELYDISGKSVKIFNYNEIYNEKINLPNLPAGNYILKIDSISKNILIN